MDLKTQKQLNLAKITSLYNNIPLVTLVNMAVSFGLIYVAWNTVALDFIYDYAAIFLGFQLIVLFVWTLYNRKYQNKEITNTNTWENLYIGTNLLVSSIFSLAYIWLMLNASPANVGLVLFLLMAQTSCLIMVCASSRKAIVWLSTIATVPSIATLISTGNIMPSAGVAIYTVLLCFIMFVNHRTIKRSFELKFQLRQQTEVVQNYKNRLEQTTIEDPVTGIYNRRFFELMINEEIRRAKRGQTTLSIAIIELDCFDLYEQQYGSVAATNCVCRIAKILTKATSRGGEFIAQFSDTKFAVLAPNVRAKDAIAFMSKMRALVSQADIEHLTTLDEHQKTVSISVGIAEFIFDSIIDIQELISQAEYALKTANTMGPNSIQVFAENVITRDNPFNSSADNKEHKVKLHIAGEPLPHTSETGTG